MNEIHDRETWTSSSQIEHGAEIRKGLTFSAKLNKPLFPILKDVQEQDEDQQDDQASEQKGSAQDQPVTEGALKEKARQIMAAALEKAGYPVELLESEKFRKALARALAKDGEIISRKTNKLWVEREVPEEPPAFVRPRTLRVGDRVQVLNWVPLGVHGAVVDIFPQGKVTKCYTCKCLVTKNGYPHGVMVRKSEPFSEEERVLALELDGKGPYPVKDKETPYPYIVKDSSIIIRFPEMATPGGETEHVSPMVV